MAAGVTTVVLFFHGVLSHGSTKLQRVLYVPDMKERALPMGILDAAQHEERYCSAEV